jgi:hypothetical protein
MFSQRLDRHIRAVHSSRVHPAICAVCCQRLIAVHGAGGPQWACGCCDALPERDANYLLPPDTDGVPTQEAVQTLPTEAVVWQHMCKVRPALKSLDGKWLAGNSRC